MSEEKLTVLVADDSRVIRKAFSRIMNESYELIESENGKDAWFEIENDQDISAVFTDWEMPGMDGLDLTRKIRDSKNPRIKSLPIIMVTSKNDDEETMQLAFDTGVNDFVSKPFDRTELLARAKSHVKKRSLSGLEETDNAVMDSVSKLGNFQYFQEQGSKLIALANNNNFSIVVALMSVDNLSEIYRKHDASELQQEEFVATMGGYISGVMRKEDSIARLGNGVFGVLLASSDMDVAFHFSQRVQQQLLKESFVLNGNHIKVGISVGLALHSQESTKTLNTLIKEAKEQLLSASKNGGSIHPPKKKKRKVKKIKLDSLDKILDLVNAKKAKHVDTNYLAQKLLPLMVYIDKSHGTELAKKLLQIIKRK